MAGLDTNRYIDDELDQQDGTPDAPKTLKEKEEPTSKDKLKGFSKKSRELIDSESTTIEQLARDFKKQQENAKEELRKFIEENPKFLNQKRQTTLLEGLESDHHDPELIKETVEAIQNLPKEKEKAEKDRINSHIELSPDDKRIIEYQKEIEDLFDPSKNKGVDKWIGDNQLQSFKQWYLQELRKTPTLAKIQELRTKTWNDREGLSPRKEQFENEIAPRLKEYKITYKDENLPLIKGQGYSERTHALECIKDSEKRLEQLRNTGLYDYNSKQQIMQEMFKAQTKGEFTQYKTRIQKLTKRESEQFTNQESTSIFATKKVKIQGKDYQAMSEKSRKAYLDYYRTTDLSERETLHLSWEKIIQNEAKLAKDLAKVYEDDKGVFDEAGFKQAMETFSSLDYMQKEKAIKEHKKIVKQNGLELTRKVSKEQQDAFNTIDKAKEKNILSTTTARKFKEVFLDTDKFIDKKTNKIDPKKIKEKREEMEAPTAVHEKSKRNLAAYEENYIQFEQELEKFAKDNKENINPSEIAKYQKRYNEGTYTQRSEIQKELTNEAQEKEKARKDLEKEEQEKGKKKSNETEKVNAESLSPSELIDQVKNLMELNTLQDSLKASDLIMEYKKANIDTWYKDSQVTLWDIKVSTAILEHTLNGETVDANNQTNSEDEVEQVVEDITSEETMENEIDQTNVQRMNLDQVQVNEDRTGKTNAVDRNLAEATKSANSQEERELAEEYLKGNDSDKDKLLETDETETSGHEAHEMSYDSDATMTREEIDHEMDHLNEHSELFDEKGIDHGRLKDNGQEKSAASLQTKQNEKEKKLDQDIMEKASKILSFRRRKRGDSEKSITESKQEESTAFEQAQKARKKRQEQILR